MRAWLHSWPEARQQAVVPGREMRFVPGNGPPVPEVSTRFVLDVRCRRAPLRCSCVDPGYLICWYCLKGLPTREGGVLICCLP